METIDVFSMLLELVLYGVEILSNGSLKIHILEMPQTKMYL